MDELFHKLANFQEQSLMPCLANEEGTVAFYFLLHILLTGWIGHWSACNIVPSLHWFPLLEKFDILAFIFPLFWSFLWGGAGQRTPPSPQFGAGRVTPPRGAGRPSLPNSTSQPIAELLFSTSYILLLNYKQISNHLKSARINFSSSTLCRHTGGRLTGRRLLIDGLRLQVDLHFCTFALCTH